MVHVLDASRGVPVAQALVDKNQKQRQEFVDEINEQYAELREEFFASLEDRKWVRREGGMVGVGWLCGSRGWRARWRCHAC